MFEKHTVLALDSRALRDLVLQSAASVVAFCNQLTGPPFNKADSSTIGGVLDHYLPGQTPGQAADQLFSQASLVWDWVELMLGDTEEPWYPQPGEVQLITAALTSFQSWKQSYVSTIDRDLGHWGRATIVAQRDWSRLNDRFTAKFAS